MKSSSLETMEFREYRPLKEGFEFADNLFDSLAVTHQFGSDQITLCGAISRESQVEANICLHLHILLGRVEEDHSANYCLLIEGPDSDFDSHVTTSSISNGNASRSGTDEMRQTMLVVIRESMEHPEHVIFRGRTKVRLKAIDDILCGHTQGADFPSAGVLVGRTILEDREFRRFRGYRPVQQSQLPSQVVQARSELSENLSSENANRERNILSLLNSIGIGSLLSIECGDQFVRLTTKKAV